MKRKMIIAVVVLIAVLAVIAIVSILAQTPALILQKERKRNALTDCQK